MGRVRTHMAPVSSGWGPSGRRFKSGLPDPEASFALLVPRGSQSWGALGGQ